MDNLTHSLTGLLLARAGTNRLSGRAALVSMLAANVPDLDVVLGLGSRAAYLDTHRGLTHGVVMIPVMAAVVVAVVGAFRPRDFRWLGAWAVAMIAVASHLLLDWTNIYGIRLGAPFSGAWFRLDITSVIDPWIWLLLLAAVLWPLLERLVSAEIGARPKPGIALARAALLALVSYDAARWVLHDRALATMESFTFNGQVPRRVLAMPSFTNPLSWRGLADLGDSWHVVTVPIARQFDPASGRTFYQAPASAEIETARRDPSVQALERFSQTLHWRRLALADPPGAVEVTVTDMRFGDPGEGFAARVVVSGGRVASSDVRFSAPGQPPRPK